MADAAARREARRRRILENSKNRLEKISGKLENVEDKKTISETDFLARCNGGFKTESNSNISTESQFHNMLLSGSNELSDVQYEILDGNVPEILSRNAFIPKEESPDAQNIENSVIFKYKINIIILAIIIRILYTLKIFQFVFENKMLVPLFAYESFDLFLFYTPATSSGILSTVILLAGVNQNLIQSVTKLFAVVRKLIGDFFVYFFTFVVFHELLNDCGFLEINFNE